MGIPVFGMVDSNTDPTSITFPIPSNDDSIKSISSIVGYISNRIIEAKGGNLNENNEQNPDEKNNNHEEPDKTPKKEEIKEEAK